MMNHRSAAISNAVFVAAIFAVAFWTVHRLAAGVQVAIHWGSDNRADAWVGGSAIQLINPIIALVLWFLLSTCPQGFSSTVESAKRVHMRFSGVFLVQLIIQLLMAMHVLGMVVA